MGRLLNDMGVGLSQGHLGSKAHGWLRRGRELEKRLVRAEDQVRKADETLRWNARRAARVRHGDLAHGELFSTLRGIARTLADNALDQHAVHRLGHQFLDCYAEVLRLSGAAVQGLVVPHLAAGSVDADPRERLRAAIEGALAWHETMTDLVGRGTLLRPGAWHVYGSLMMDVERLLADLEDYAGMR